MRLNDFQERFKDIILDTPEALEDVPESFASLFHAEDIALSERLKVYRSTIVGGIAENLCKTFPLLEALVGKDFLLDMARRFVMAHPPESGCLNLYGRGFDAFIRSYAPAHGLPYLTDMASLEIAMNEAYYADDDEALTARDLAAFPPEALGDLVLKPRESVRLIRSSYALDALRSYCLEPGGQPPNLNKKTYLLVLRPSLDVAIVKLEHSEYFFLGLLDNRVSLGAAAAETLERYHGFDFTVFFEKFLSLETFKGLHSNS